MILKRPIIQQIMQLLLILQIIVRLVKKSWFLKTMLHLSAAYQKINGVQIDNAEDLDVVTPMYNLLKYSKNYLKTTGGL